MDLLDFLYPQQAQAARLREIAQTLRESNAAKGATNRETARIQADVNTLALVCMGLVATLVEKGVITELELQMHLQAIDGLDAVADEGLDPDVMRGALGLKKPSPAPKRAGLKKPLPGRKKR
ncbi:MAG: hypothetical protein KDB90_15865 [Planctomycetes bacterium]|nr:hypothetical protein [Planctomycetota bacterium]